MRSSLRNKSVDKNINQNKKNNSTVQHTTNKFSVLDDSDSEENINGNLNTASQNNDTQSGNDFVEVKKSKKNKSKISKFEENEKTQEKLEEVKEVENKLPSFKDQFLKKDVMIKNNKIIEQEIEPLKVSSGFSKFADLDGNDQWEKPFSKKNKYKRDELDGKKLDGKKFYNENEDNIENENHESNEKQLYIETKNSALDLGNNMFLHCSWTVWTHKETCPDWTEKSYTNIYEIDSIGKFWRFFNNFHLFDKKENQFFIMRNKIKPIWEDNENRRGGICSIKFDSFSRPGKIDVGTEMMICICLLIMNETFLLNNEEINGISYAVKNRSVLIKIWSKNYTTNIPDKIPTSLMIKFDTVLRNLDRSHYAKKNENKISIQYKPIKPEDEEKC